jgi:methionine sulfoxide reductase heme-binding subunit
VVLRRPRAWAAAAWILGLLPLARLAWWLAGGGQGLGANPIERVLHQTGWWALLLLLATLAVTPLRRLTRHNPLIRLRRPLGLLAFLYASLHLLVYVALDQLLAWDYLLEDLLARPFIGVGFVAWLLLLPLAVTSTRRWIARLGSRWNLLHRLVFPATALGLLHFHWRVRADTRLPLVLTGVFLILLALRLRPGPRPRPRALSGGRRSPEP